MRLSLATKIFLGFALVVCTFGAVTVFSVLTLHGVGENIRVVSRTYLPLSAVGASIESFHKEYASALQPLMVNERDPEDPHHDVAGSLVYPASAHDASTRRTLIRVARAFHPEDMRALIQKGRGHVQAGLDGVSTTEREELLQLDRTLDDLARHDDDYVQKASALLTLLESDQPDPAAVTQSVAALSSKQQTVDRDIKLFTVGLDAHVSLLVNQASAEERRGAWAIIVLTLGAIALGLLVTVGSLRVLAPIRKLTEGAVRIGRGDYSEVVGSSGSDEVALLAREFNAMAASLREREAQLAQKQAELVRAERLAAMGRITAQITHEIRNPLSSIGLNAEMLEDALSAASFENDEVAREGRELLRAIAREVDRLTEVTEQYLRFARAPKPQLAAEDASAVANALLDFVSGELKQVGVQVERDLGPSPCWALVDEGQLRQALLNLVRNAREALSGKPGTITVRTRNTPEGVEVQVQDDGPGISPEDQARIFDPFFTTKQKGTGLGLAVTQQIIREHGGELRCSSAPGQGTCFTICLPRAEAPRVHKSEAQAQLV
jgi:signal transduction histidine kinase